MDNAEEVVRGKAGGSVDIDHPQDKLSLVPGIQTLCEPLTSALHILTYYHTCTALKRGLSEEKMLENYPKLSA